jgi:hypothetical protein
MPVKDIVTHGLITVAPGNDLNRVMRLMTRHRVRHLPVLRYGKLAGVINIGDVGTNHASWRNHCCLKRGNPLSVPWPSADTDFRMACVVFGNGPNAVGARHRLGMANALRKPTQQELIAFFEEFSQLNQGRFIRA